MEVQPEKCALETKQHSFTCELTKRSFMLRCSPGRFITVVRAKRRTQGEEGEGEEEGRIKGGRDGERDGERDSEGGTESGGFLWKYGERDNGERWSGAIGAAFYWRSHCSLESRGMYVGRGLSYGGRIR